MNDFFKSGAVGSNSWLFCQLTNGSWGIINNKLIRPTLAQSRIRHASSGGMDISTKLGESPFASVYIMVQLDDRTKTIRHSQRMDIINQNEMIFNRESILSLIPLDDAASSSSPRSPSTNLLVQRQSATWFNHQRWL